MSVQSIAQETDVGIKITDKRAIAHHLLIELLAHQFAFPVRWIETQDALFLRQDAIQRFIELGPAKVLTGMARRTRDTKFASNDLSKSIGRQFLASTHDIKNLLYEYDLPSPGAKTHEDETENPAPGLIPPSTLAVLTPQAVAVATASISDVPISGQEIVRALAAHKIKKGIEQVDPSRSIKEISKGKSTLQNELIGDLGNEFGSMPDAAEDLSLAALGDALECNHTGQLGKQSSSLIAKLISSKMPPRFNHGSICDHLNNTWGLGPSRHAAVLLFAVTTEPACRLPSVAVAKEYFNGLTERYAKSCGLILQANAVHNKTPQVSNRSVDPAFLETLSKEQQKLATKQFKVLAEYLQTDHSEHARIADLESIQKGLQEKLDLWHSEFAEEFATGIAPCFDVKKFRRFNSSWNLARQEVLCLYFDAENGSLHQNSRQLDFICRKIANRSDESLLTLVNGLNARSFELNSPFKGFGAIGRRLASSIAKQVGKKPAVEFVLPMTGPQTKVDVDGSIQYSEIPRAGQGHAFSYPDLLKGGTIHGSAHGDPFVHLRTQRGREWTLNHELTSVLLQSFSTALASGLSFAGKDVLVTGAGPGSIGAEIVSALLLGGARVVVTTSRAPSDTSKYYQKLYEDCGARGSELLVIPSNQGSARDCEALIDHIYSKSGLGRSLDAIIPFAAISEGGIEIDAIEARSELAHRLMLVNVLRLLGHIIRNKKERNINCRPTQVLLPLSPNHGNFGGDGLYSESKLGLESLLNRFHAESWSDELIICGVIIGWTRGTGLMSRNDIVAEAIESNNVLTFSPQEMAFNILMLMTPAIVQLCETQPIVADISGGLGILGNCQSILSKARSDIDLAVEIVQAIKNEDAHEAKITNSHSSQACAPAIKKRSTLQIGFPLLPDFDADLKPLQHLQGMIEPSSTVVIVGFSELGPWGSSRTRWEMESRGKLSQEGYIEMAWMMNLIKHFDGVSKGEHYVGWVDAKSGEHIHDQEIEMKYGMQILEHSGIRLVDPELCGGYDPERKEYLQEIAIEEDLPEFDATLATAEAFKLRHGEHVTIRRLEGQDEYRVQVKAGGHILVPKSVPFSWGSVAGQIPKGWDPIKYGIQEDLVSQVDPVTLYTLCCAAEALYSAGIIDSLEIFKHIHLCELGNFIGSAMGGMIKTRHMYKDRYLDKEVQGDVIQETYLNTAAAWMNMLLLGSAGPIKTPTGTCATGVESLDSGFESIVCGKTKMCFVGGVDDFQEDESYGFSTMKATVNVTEELAQGRNPKEMSRPTTETRAGFVESQGCGMQILTTAELALEMGLPIYAVVASSTMAADKISRSVPAPGQGVLSFARESPDAIVSPLLNLNYRRKQMRSTINDIRQRHFVHVQKMNGIETPDSTDSGESSSSYPGFRDVILTIEEATDARVRAARRLWGNDFRVQNPGISPIRASLAVWGLTVDDIDIVSMHGTSTKANDKNESEVINKQMSHLDRTLGVPLLAICQKSLTGHPKGPAAAWMLNGCLQAMSSGLIPGNQNADNVDETLKGFEYIVFPTKSIHTGDVKAFLLNSFGFGQKGGQVIGVNPRYLFATLTRDEFYAYEKKVSERKKFANRAYIKAVLTNTVFEARPSPPYAEQDETDVLLNPLARTSGEAGKSLRFDSAHIQPRPQTKFQIPDLEKAVNASSKTKAGSFNQINLTQAWIEETAGESHDLSVTVGVGVAEMENFSVGHEIFTHRHHPVTEQNLASQSHGPQAEFASEWAAKEAVLKSLRLTYKEAGPRSKDIEIINEDGNTPRVKLHNEAFAMAREKGVQDFRLSLTHSSSSVTAVALAIRRPGEPSY